jgi:DNA-binding NtrC family response regulator
MKPLSLSIIDSTRSFTKATDRGSIIRILHVDNDACILRTSKLILEMNGAYYVETAMSVDKAFEQMREKEYDVIVSDYHMPGKGGVQFLKDLRERGNRIPFIFFSGVEGVEISIKALGLEADGYFIKVGLPEVVYGDLSHGIESAYEKARTEIEFGEIVKIWSNKEVPAFPLNDL